MFVRNRVLLFAAGLFAAGCAGRLDETKTIKFSHRDVNEVSYPLAAQPAEQKLTVEVTSAEPVNVYIILADKFDAFEKEIVAEKKAAASAAHKLGAKSDTITATIPAKTECRVFLNLPGSSKDTDVKVHLTNRK